MNISAVTIFLARVVVGYLGYRLFQRAAVQIFRLLSGVRMGGGAEKETHFPCLSSQVSLTSSQVLWENSHHFKLTRLVFAC